MLGATFGELASVLRRGGLEVGPLINEVGTKTYYTGGSTSRKT